MIRRPPRSTLHGLRRQRQMCIRDRDKPRVSIGAKLVADLLSAAGIDRLITMDLHADQIQGFFDVPVDHLYASGVILPYLQSLHIKDLVIASPDVGGSKRANTFAKYLGCPLVLCNKTQHNIPKFLTISLCLMYNAISKPCQKK